MVIPLNDKSNPLQENLETTRELKGFTAKIFTLFAVAMSLYHLYSSGVEMLPQIQHKAIHLSFALFLTYLLYPATRRQRGKVSWVDLLCAGLSLLIGAYVTFDYMSIVYRAGSPNSADLILGGIMIILVLEATRRTMGWTLVLVALIFLGYALFGHLIPGQLGHRQYSLSRVIEHMFLTSEGVYGVAIYVTATFVFVFMLLGAFLSETGGAQSFIDIAFSLTGRYRGGPAKAAVVASGLMGTISGSSFANVAGTGVFTIPLMKSVGYRPDFAGGVEAASSSGGQIMPPIMGAAAFIMAEMTGIPYGRLIIHAAVPALLYYLSVFLMVDLEAAKLKLKGLRREDVPDFCKTLKKGGFLLLAPIIIVYMLIAGYSPIKASFTAVIFVIAASMFSRETRLSPAKFVAALEKGARTSLSLIAACAVAGLIVGTVTLTGLGTKFADLIVSLASDQLYPALLLTMVASIIMGMGMPTAALYIILGSMVAPALVKMGVPVIAAHMFIFYFGCYAAVTPPVALSSYLAAAIAKADPAKTAFAGLRLASAGLILPFMFVLSPKLLLWEIGSVVEALGVVFTSLIGVFALASAIEGYFIGWMRLYERVVLFVASLFLIYPGLFTDAAGMVAVGLILLLRYAALRRANT